MRMCWWWVIRKGLFDDVHNLPIVRSASIASVYHVPFQGQPLGVIDANLPPSTAGAALTRGASAVRTQDGQTTMGSGENLLAGKFCRRGVHSPQVISPSEGPRSTPCSTRGSFPRSSVSAHSSATEPS